jgi:hypothetical protein
MTNNKLLRTLRIYFIIIASLFFFALFVASAVRNVYYTPHQGTKWFGGFAKYVKLFAEIPGDLKTFVLGNSMEDPKYNTPAIIKNETDKDGFTRHVDVVYESSPKLLISLKKGRYDIKFQLLDINTGDLIKQWNPDGKMLSENIYNPALDIFLDLSKNKDFFYVHPLLLPDSAIIANSQVGLIKIDNGGKVVWVKNDRNYHHSIEQDVEGNLYVPTRPMNSRVFNFFPSDYNDTTDNYMDDEITKIDPITGETLYCKSVTELLIENGYEWILLAKGMVEKDQIHLNDIEPARFDSKYWKTGDLLLSSRHLSAVFLYRPSTNKVLWLKMGPWYNQHDVDFLSDNKIVVFGNDVLRFFSKDCSVHSREYFSEAMPQNQVYFYNFENDEITTPYDQLMKKENIKTPTQGRCDILPNGDIYIEETDNGRILFGDSTRAKITFVKRKDEEYLHLILWSRIIY